MFIILKKFQLTWLSWIDGLTTILTCYFFWIRSSVGENFFLDKVFIWSTSLFYFSESTWRFIDSKISRRSKHQFLKDFKILFLVTYLHLTWWITNSVSPKIFRDLISLFFVMRRSWINASYSSRLFEHENCILSPKSNFLSIGETRNTTTPIPFLLSEPSKYIFYNPKPLLSYSLCGMRMINFSLWM